MRVQTCIYIYIYYNKFKKLFFKQVCKRIFVFDTNLKLIRELKHPFVILYLFIYIFTLNSINKLHMQFKKQLNTLTPYVGISLIILKQYYVKKDI